MTSKNVIDKDTVCRYQLVMTKVGGEQEVALYQVAVSSSNPSNIKYVLDPDPVAIVGESVDEVMYIIAQANSDIREYGIIQEDILFNSVEYEDQGTDMMYQDEFDLLEDYDQDKMYDKNDNVLDIVDFINNNGG